MLSPLELVSLPSWWPTVTYVVISRISPSTQSQISKDVTQQNRYIQTYKYRKSLAYRSTTRKVAASKMDLKAFFAEQDALMRMIENYEDDYDQGTLENHKRSYTHSFLRFTLLLTLGFQSHAFCRRRIEEPQINDVLPRQSASPSFSVLRGGSTDGSPSSLTIGLSPPTLTSCVCFAIHASNFVNMLISFVKLLRRPDEENPFR